ncbi:hypothetical protein ACWCRD_04395 [Streptomyces sp. NPDC002092]
MDGVYPEAARRHDLPEAEQLQNWLVRAGQSADEWTVMVNEARGDRWENYSMNCTEFVVAALAGDVHSNVLSSRFPLAEHEFRQLVAV